MATSSAPFVLHRIPEDLIFHENSISKSPNKRDKPGQCCLTIENIVLERGITCEYTKDTDAKGISTFASYDDSAMEAAHNLFTETGDRLPCFILAKDHSTPNMLFVYDGDVTEHQVCAYHVLITPSTCVPFEIFNRIALCTLPEDSWMTCPYMLTGETQCDLQIPESPDDTLLSLSCNALEEFALDCSKQGNARRAARLAQFHIANLTQWDQLQHLAHLSFVVAEALLRWQDMQFAEFPIATKGLLRGMIQDVSEWKFSVASLNVSPLQTLPI